MTLIKYEIKNNYFECPSVTPAKNMSMFGSVIVVVFQIAFHVKIYVNDIFLFLKIIFDISTSNI